MARDLWQLLSHPWFARTGIRVTVLRLDRLHPVVSGNKYFKLLHNLADAKRQGHTAILTFGGPFSNHLHAAAAMAQAEGLQAIGLVRGLYPGGEKTRTLLDCEAMGMALHGLTRADYARRDAPNFLQDIRHHFGSPFIIPEGGSNAAGRAGAGTIAALLPEDATHVCCAIGTGTTLAGIRAQLPVAVRMLGFPAFRQAGYIRAHIDAHLTPPQRDAWSLVTGYEEGGFGKMTARLKALMHTALHDLQLPLDRIYTAKMMLGLRELIAAGVFQSSAHIVAIHTGGLQGNQAGPIEQK